MQNKTKTVCNRRRNNYRTRREPTIEFHDAYRQFIEGCLGEDCSPERRRKLREGLGFGELGFLEKVWWPLFHSFDHLHPEYEVADYTGGSRFIDFAYLRGKAKLAIEIDGFSSHAQNLDRRGFSYRLHRQNVLVLDGWDVLRFPFDDVDSRPRRCQQTIQQYMGSRFAGSDAQLPESLLLTATDREIVRLARGLPGPMKPADVQRHLQESRTTTYRRLRKLVAQGLLVPASGTKRIRAYALSETARNLGI